MDIKPTAAGRKGMNTKQKRLCGWDPAPELQNRCECALPATQVARQKDPRLMQEASRHGTMYA